jgi:hypothetical protein
VRRDVQKDIGKKARQFVARAPLRLFVTRLDIAVAAGAYLVGSGRAIKPRLVGRYMTRQGLAV